MNFYITLENDTSLDSVIGSIKIDDVDTRAGFILSYINKFSLEPVYEIINGKTEIVCFSFVVKREEKK